MRRNVEGGLQTALIALLAALLGLAAPVAAQDTSIPRTSDGRPDFSGIWQTLGAADDDLEPHGTRKDAPPGRGIVDGGVIPYQPAALERRKKNFAARAAADPRSKCFTLGTPRGVYGGEPFQIFQRPRDLTVVYQFGHPVRTIHTNGTRHPEGALDFWLGDSRAAWEGDTLVVDVTQFNGETWLDRAGNFHSDALHVIERFTPAGPDHIDYTVTIEDPKVFTRPWTMRMVLYRHKEKNFQILEYECYAFDHEKYYP